MRKTIFLVITFLLYCSAAHAAWNATFPADNELFSDTPAGLRANFAAIALGTDPALLITDAKVSPSAAINDTKLATITTAGKVNGAALTGLASIPSGAGKIPNANINTGTGAAQIVVLDGAAKFPPIDISQATGINASNITTGVLPTAQVPTLDAAKIGSGVFLPARLGTGTTPGTFLRVDGNFSVIPTVSISCGFANVSNVANTITSAYTYYNVTGLKTTITLNNTGSIKAVFSGYTWATGIQPSYRIIYNGTEIANSARPCYNTNCTVQFGGIATSVPAGTYDVFVQVDNNGGGVTTTTSGMIDVTSY